jgi:signal transduction histidine kinase
VAELTAQSALKSKTQFLAFMAHELRTPLHCIIAGIDDIEVAESERAKLSVLMRTADLLSQLINSVLDLSKLEAGTLVTSLFCVVIAVVSLFSWYGRCALLSQLINSLLDLSKLEAGTLVTSLFCVVIAVVSLFPWYERNRRGNSTKAGTFTLGHWFLYLLNKMCSHVCCCLS